MDPTPDDGPYCSTVDGSSCVDDPSWAWMQVLNTVFRDGALVEGYNGSTED